MTLWFRGISRRQCLATAPLGIGFLKANTLPDGYPMQPAQTVREMVTVAHGNLQRVKELVASRPSLAKAAWDWGFGDWESALGAASHTGQREIAEFLIANGARPTLFSAAMLGQLDVVKAFIAAQPGVQRIEGPHSISLLSHAKAGGTRAEPVRRFLEELGDADHAAMTPLTDADLAVLPGLYLPGEIQITANGRALSIQRPGTVPRGLMHLGGRIFSPAGAAAVRIAFHQLEGKSILSLKDGDLALTAYRTGPSA